MNRDTIIELAREAGFRVMDCDGEAEVMEGDDWHIQTDVVEAFAALVAERVQNECIELVEKGMQKK